MATMTPDDLRVLMEAMTNGISTAMTRAMTQIIQETKRDPIKGHIDHRSIGGPPEWDSACESQFLEWQIKVQAWLVNQDARAI